jgi:hypothetical protein
MVAIELVVRAVATEDDVPSHGTSQSHESAGQAMDLAFTVRPTPPRDLTASAGLLDAR